MDHVSDYLFIWNQVTPSASEKIKYKVISEIDALNMVVVLNTYHKYKGVFTAEQFMNQLIEANQNIQLCRSIVTHPN